MALQALASYASSAAAGGHQAVTVTLEAAGTTYNFPNTISSINSVVLQQIDVRMVSGVRNLWKNFAGQQGFELFNLASPPKLNSPVITDCFPENFMTRPSGLELFFVLDSL